MNLPAEKNKNRSKVISILVIIWPLIAVIAALHIVVIFLIISINDNSGILSSTMQNSSVYVSDASALMARTSMLGETSSNYILMPETDEGEVNFGPLTAYAQEMKNSISGADMEEQFQKYNVSDEVKARIAVAGECSDEMVLMEKHAIALVNDVYPLPEIPPLAELELPELTEEEKAYTDGQKVSTARGIILGGNYAKKKAAVSADTRAAVSEIQQTAGKIAGETSARIAFQRMLLWIFTALIIAMIFIAFILVFRLLITPLGKFVDLIKSDKMMEEKKGVKEIRLVASAYNSLLRRRDALDNLLRYAAETDSLTNLPNRYGFEQYLLDVEEKGYSMAIILFDVNYLKQTNDTYGHDAGDRLLKRAAECILKCFGNESGNNCFRFGGDEFAAVIKESTHVKVEGMIRLFEDEQKRSEISISWGYAFADKSDAGLIKNLIKEADVRMYEQKKRMHEGAV